jgi:hypothetical protein
LTVTRRSVKGSSLTYAEVDENFRDLRFDTTLDRVLENGDSSSRNMIVGDITANTLTVSNLQNDTVFYKTRKNKNQAFSDVTEIDIRFDVVDFDTHSGKIDDYIYEIQVDGLYEISAQVNAATGYVRDFIFGVQKSTDGGSTWSTIMSTGNRYYGGTDDIQEGTVFTQGCHNLSVGDRLKVRAEVNTVTSSTGNFQHAANQILSGTLTESVLSWFEVRKVGNKL